MNIQQLELEATFTAYMQLAERAWATHELQRGPIIAAVREAWDLFCQDCADAGVDVAPYISRAETVSARRLYGPDAPAVHVVVREQPDACEGGGCACRM